MVVGGGKGGGSAGSWWCLYKSVMCNCIYTINL